MVSFYWHILSMKRDPSNGGVFEVHWDCSGLRETFEQNISGVCTFTPDSSDNQFTQFNDLTEDQVLQWVWDNVSKLEVESAVASALEQYFTPMHIEGFPDSWYSAE